MVPTEGVTVETLQGKQLAQGASGSGHWLRQGSAKGQESEEYQTADDDTWGPWRETPETSGTRRSDDQDRESAAAAAAPEDSPREHPSAACELFKLLMVQSDPGTRTS